MMPWDGDYRNGSAWTLMALGMIAFSIVLILSIVLLVRYLRGPAQPSGPQAVGPTPEQIVAERFARGEIDENEYNGRLGALHGPVRS